MSRFAGKIRIKGKAIGDQNITVIDLGELAIFLDLGCLDVPARSHCRSLSMVGQNYDSSAVRTWVQS
jgi:hypothetical protein